MAKLAKMPLFASAKGPKETALDKTTRIVRRMNVEDAEKRHRKVARLRSERLKKEAGEAVKTGTAAHYEPRKTR